MPPPASSSVTGPSASSATSARASWGQGRARKWDASRPTSVTRTLRSEAARDPNITVLQHVRVGPTFLVVVRKHRADDPMPCAAINADDTKL
eukprot:5599486-Pyramimonas_sp.AAC.2